MNLPNSDNQDFGNYSKRVARNNPRVTNESPEEIKILPPDKQAIFREMCMKEEGMGLAKPLR